MLQNVNIGGLSLLSEPAKPESLIPHLAQPNGISSTTQSFRLVTSVNETLPTISELSLPVVSTTMSTMPCDVASTHSELALLSLGGTSRRHPQGPPSVSLPVILLCLVTADVMSTTSQTPGLMSLPTSVVSSCPPLLLHIAPAVSMPPVQCCGKAPPVDRFTVEDPQIRFNDWLPTLNRATVWNGWSEEETLMQLAGYLRNRAI